MKQKKRIMLVDDDPDFVALNRALLEKASYEVLVAASGDDCLEKVRGRKPDLIILDMMMSSMNDGFEVSRVLRNTERTKGIPLVMLTSANRRLPVRLEPDETWLPVDLLMEKPVEPDLLLQVVAQMLAPPSSGRGVRTGRPIRRS